MKHYLNKTGNKLVVVYVTLVLLAFTFFFASVETNAFAYIYLIFLTIPWSLILAVIALLHEGVGELSTFYKISLFVVFIVINCLLINRLGLKYDNRQESKKEVGKKN